jgi:nicotinamidase-related amidase
MITSKPKIDVSKLGVMIIDMQDKYLELIDPRKKKEMIYAQLALIELCSFYDYPVIILEYALSGSTTERIFEAVKRVPRRFYFEKSRNNGFTNPRVGDIVEELGLKHLCLAGLNAPYCVRDTGAGAVLNGQRIMTARQLLGVQVHREYAFKPSLRWFKSNGFCPDHYSGITNLMIQDARSKSA